MIKNEEMETSASGFVEKATSGVLYLYEKDYIHQRERLAEFLTKQNQLMSDVDQELAKLSALESLKIDDMMTTLKTCQNRLHTIKDRMIKASLKAKRLKERSLRLQQTKQKEALERELRREAQLTREQEMILKSPTFKIPLKSEAFPNKISPADVSS